MTCPTCRDTGHRPDAPWLLCEEPGCERAAWVRQRSEYVTASTHPMWWDNSDMPPVVSGGTVVRMLGVVP